MKRAMVGILAVVFLAAFAPPVMATSPYSSDVKSFASPSTDCGNVVVTNGGTLIAVIHLTGACAANTSTTLEVCAVLDDTRTLIDTVSDTNTDGRISVWEGTKITTFESGQAFDFLEFRAPNTNDCEGVLEYTSGQPR